jgi:ribA/ribD-fused uncharacterized protein
MITRPAGIYGFTGSYGYLSNFYIEPDRTFVEYEYQRAKCAGFAGRDKFDALFKLGKLTPKMAKAIGRKVQIRDDWEDVKLEIMLFYVSKKFKDHPTLAALLKQTRTLHLEETNWWGDTFWGVCNGRGFNALGEILMQVRGELA